MSRAIRKSTIRCGHFEQMKVGRNWKCITCGQILTITESIQNSLELSDVLRSAIDNKRTLGESLDEMLGRKEWEKILERIPVQTKGSRRRLHAGSSRTGPVRRRQLRFTDK